MPRYNTRGDVLQFNAQYGAFKDIKHAKVKAFMERGAVPDKLFGVPDKRYQSHFGAVAHGTEQKKRFSNLLNNGIDDEVFFQVHTRNENGDLVAKTDAVKMGDKTYHPDEKGIVRITDQAKIDMFLEIDKYRRERTDKLMDICRLGDDIAAYVFGMSEENWKEMCRGTNPVLPPGLNMHEDLKKLDCTLEYINSLPPSMTQTQSVAKLRKIVEYFEKNVNIEGLSTVSENKEMDSDKYVPRETPAPPVIN